MIILRDSKRVERHHSFCAAELDEYGNEVEETVLE